MLQTVRRSTCVAIIAFVALLAPAMPALAKMGVTSTTIPSDTAAGQPFEVGMTMEDHDGALTVDADIVVLAQNVATGEALEFPARPQGDHLHWAATVTLPSDGTWILTVASPTLGFRQDLRTISVAANPALGVTRAELDSAMDAATEGLTKQVAGMAVEIDTLQKQLTDLTTERDTLQKQIAELQNRPAPAATDAGVSGWLAAAIGAVTATVVLAFGSVTAARAGLLGRPREASLAPVVAGSGD